MATYYETQTVFEFNWVQVAQAFWNRYPNPASTHVLTEDTIKREIRDGKLYTRRLLSKTNPVPKWGERFYNAKSVKIIEDSILDPENRTLTTYTRNVGFKKVLRVDEKVEYREQEDGRTIAIRSAWISSQIFGFSRAIRAFGVERFKSNCNKTVLGFNFVLNNMFPSKVPAVTQIQQQQQHHLHHQHQEQSQQSKFEHNSPQSLSRFNKVKEIGRNIYISMKKQAVRLYQVFSVKN